MSLLSRPTDNCPICSNLEESTISRILALIQKKSYAKNSLIFDQDQQISGLYLIGKGSVKVSKISAGGKEIVLRILKAGETFGETSLLESNPPTDTIATLENSEIFYLAKRDLEPLLRQKPQLYQSVVSSLIRWMQNLNEVIENMNAASAKEKVLLYLVRLRKEQAQDIIQLDKKKHDVALMLGLRPETFSRTLAQLEEEGIIRLNHKQIVITKEFPSEPI